MRAVTTRIVAGQKGFSADAHTHNHNPDEKSGLAGTSTTALLSLLHGRTWSDTATLARIERGPGAGLWDDEHRD